MISLYCVMIRKLIIMLGIIILGNNAHAQIALTYEQSASKGVSYLKLDSLYKSAVNADAALAVFKTSSEQAALQAAYTQFFKMLGAYLQANNFKWEKPVRCFNRIYMAPNGAVEHFLFNFAPGQVSPEKEKQFASLLNEFVKTNTFGLTADEKFAQCSPIKYSD
jgi:hypothetical protein